MGNQKITITNNLVSLDINETPVEISLSNSGPQGAQGIPGGPGPAGADGADGMEGVHNTYVFDTNFIGAGRILFHGGQTMMTVTSFEIARFDNANKTTDLMGEALLNSTGSPKGYLTLIRNGVSYNYKVTSVSDSFVWTMGVQYVGIAPISDQTPSDGDTIETILYFIPGPAGQQGEVGPAGGTTKYSFLIGGSNSPQINSVNIHEGSSVNVEIASTGERVYVDYVVTEGNVTFSFTEAPPTDSIKVWVS